VALSWAWSYLTFERGSRLITGADGAAQPPSTTSTAGKPERVRDAA
jgi:hypothetical protein